MASVSEYKEYFKMSHEPFTGGIDADFLYKSAGTAAMLNKLRLAAQSNSFAVLTGEPGTGKSTLLRMFARSLSPEEYLVLYVSMSNATPRWIYSVPLEIMGIKSHIYVNDARHQFHREIDIQRETYNKKVVMILDEAHLFAASYRRYDLLEEIRFLLNGKQYDSGSPLALIMAGQTELWDLLRKEKCKAIIQRIMYVCNTEPLGKDEIGPYMAAHLRWSGCPEQLFSSEAVEAVAELSEGCPRIINKLCAHALNYASLNNEKVVTGDLVRRAGANEVIDIILKQRHG